MPHRRWNSNRFWWWTGTMIAALALWGWLFAGFAFAVAGIIGHSWTALALAVGWGLISGSLVLNYRDQRPRHPTQFGWDP